MSRAFFSPVSSFSSFIIKFSKTKNHTLPVGDVWLILMFKKKACSESNFSLRKEVIQPHVPVRLPCYDLAPVISPAFGSTKWRLQALPTPMA